jgi:hypothetical protein
MATVEDILLMQGRSRANAVREQGRIKAIGWTNLADIVTGGLQTWSQQQQIKQQQQQEEADARDLATILFGPNPPDPKQILSRFGPDRGGKLLDGLKAAAARHGQAPRDWLAGGPARDSTAALAACA